MYQWMVQMKVDVVTEHADFSDFYRDEYPAQLRRAFLLLGHEADAGEAVADAFTSVLARWDRIAEPGPYLNRCVLNSCRDVARRRSRTTAEVLELPARNDEVEAQVEVADLLLSLPFRQRAMVVLRYYGGHTENEIADALGCRPGSVGPTLYRALERLRGALR